MDRPPAVLTKQRHEIGREASWEDVGVEQGKWDVVGAGGMLERIVITFCYDNIP